MHILIYEALPDINKAKIFSEMANQLQKQGHKVLLLLEESLIYTLNGQLTVKGVINCKHTVATYIASDPNSNYTILPAKKASYKNVTNSTLKTSLDIIETARNSYYPEVLRSFQPDVTFIWNGRADYQANFVALTKRFNLPLLHIEHGWFPQSSTFYVDPLGVNGESELSKASFKPINSKQIATIKQWRKEFSACIARQQERPKHVFIPLQVDTDTNITLSSPFRNMAEFIEYLEEWLPEDYSATFRPHPLAEYAYPLNSKRKNFVFDYDSPIEQLIAESSTVIGINSTVLLQSIAYGKKTLAFGEGVFSSSQCIPVLSLSDNFLSTKKPDESQINDFLHHLVFTKQLLLGDYSRVLESFSYPNKHKKNEAQIAYNRYSRMTVFVRRLIHTIAIKITS